MRSAIKVHGRALSDGGLLRQRDDSGSVTPFLVHVWTSQEAPGDAELLVRCRGPGARCGVRAGDLAAALMARGVPALGVDIAPSAVALARLRGVPALARSVYERLPGDGGG